MKQRFETVRKIADAFRAGLAGGAPAKPSPGQGEGNEDRFGMKPGEVRIIRGGGARIDREPGEPRHGA